MLRAVIFDMDGTLLDSEVIHYIVIHEIIQRELGYDQSLEEYMGYCGVPDAEMWPAILMDTRGLAGAVTGAGRIRELSEELERLHWAEYDQYIEKNGVESFPGVRELFEALKKEGLKIGIATGSLGRIVKKNLEMMGISQYVDAAATSEDCENGKPAPDIFLLAAKLLGADPSECLVVEDSGNGLLAAQRAGMSRVGFTGSRLPSDVKNAPVVFNDYREVTVEDFYRWHGSMILSLA